MQEIAEEIARDETAHVALLRRTLGSDAVPIPQLNLGTAFSTAANAAVGETLNPAFSPYANDLFFLAGAFIFEVRARYWVSTHCMNAAVHRPTGLQIFRHSYYGRYAP